MRLTGGLDSCEVLISHNVEVKSECKSPAIKRPPSETACPLSQGSGEADEACFLSEREDSRFFVKFALDKQVQQPACQPRRGFRFDRRLLAFHPRLLTEKRGEDC